MYIYIYNTEISSPKQTQSPRRVLLPCKTSILLCQTWLEVCTDDFQKKSIPHPVFVCFGFRDSSTVTGLLARSVARLIRGHSLPFQCLVSGQPFTILKGLGISPLKSTSGVRLVHRTLFRSRRCREPGALMFPIGAAWLWLCYGMSRFLPTEHRWILPKTQSTCGAFLQVSGRWLQIFCVLTFSCDVLFSDMF